MRKKVTVVGGGFVGSTTAQRIVDLELADVVLTDILDGPPAGKALDMMESTPVMLKIRLIRGLAPTSFNSPPAFFAFVRHETSMPMPELST